MKLKKLSNNIWLVAEGKDKFGIFPAPEVDVKLITYPENVEKLIAFAARTTYKGHKARV